MTPERLKLLAGIPLVPITEEGREIARELISPSMIPTEAAADALHVAAAACAGVEYLLTLNCRHIANAHILPRVYSILGTRGFGGLLICTPAEFLGDRYDVEESDT